MIRFENIEKQYGTKPPVLAELNITIDEGELFVLVGPSGSGKTTTLKMINRLIEPTDGNIYIRDKKINTYNIQELRWNIGYVLQQIALFPNLTVAENIELIPEIKKWPKEKRLARTKELLEKVNLPAEQYMHRLPRELSGGEQQRIGILRALAAEPDIILMDEPFSALDPISRHQLQELIKTIHDELKNTIVFVTHDMDEAMKLGDRICVMKDGHMIQCDTPINIQTNPKDDFVSRFFTLKEQVSKPIINDLIDNNLFSTKTMPILCEISRNEPLESAMALLLESEYVSIRENGAILGYITAHHILAFMVLRGEHANG